jgi:peptidoglycan/LPS O-acetylase OafA/YrhL
MTSPNSPGRETGHIAHLDGWRGLAISTLLLGHFLPLPGINFGTVGVNLFFVLSGLLMGGLLFEKGEPISRFYLRRASRIIPAHSAFILVVCLFYALRGIPTSCRETLAALLFVNNYIGPEAGPGTAVMPFGHIWSLSVEEHGYIALSLVAIASRKALFSAALGVRVLFVISICLALCFQWMNPPKLAFTYWLHTEVAAFGILATALWVASKRPFISKHQSTAIAPILLVAGIAFHWWSTPLAIQRLLGVGCFAIAICSLSVTKGWFADLLSWSPLRQLGVWSYSIYLWQQPFYIWIRADEPPNTIFALAMALACGLISYYVIERPARTYLNARWQSKHFDAFQKQHPK